jgi:hypothetical protein
LKKNELCIDHQDGRVGFTVLTNDDKQLDFGIDIEQWEQLKTFIDDSICDFERTIKTNKIQNIQEARHK